VEKKNLIKKSSEYKKKGEKKENLIIDVYKYITVLCYSIQSKIDVSNNRRKYIIYLHQLKRKLTLLQYQIHLKIENLSGTGKVFYLIIGFSNCIIYSKHFVEKSLSPIRDYIPKIQIIGYLFI